MWFVKGIFMKLNPKRFKGDAEEQDWLLPPSIGELVPEAHEARLVKEVVDTLDLSNLYANYGWEGGEAFHPKILLRVLFYSYSVGQRSSRKIAKNCTDVVSYMYLANRKKPNFRTVSDFRKNNLGILQDLFKQIVQMCYHLGMIQIGQISLDGTKVRANASSRKHIADRDKLEKELQRLEQQIAQMFDEAEAVDQQEDQLYGEDSDGRAMPDELKKAQSRKEKIKELLSELEVQKAKKMSLTDKEARFMKTTSGTKISYNGQVATENQVILAHQLGNDEMDPGYLKPMVDELEHLAVTLKGKSEFPLENVKASADSAYDSTGNLIHLKERKIEGYIPHRKARIQAKEARGEILPKPFAKDKFQYDAEQDTYICPADQKLLRIEQKKKSNTRDTYKQIKYQVDACLSCQYQSECVKSKTGIRSVFRYEPYDDLREEIDARLKQEKGKIIYKNRSTDVEPVFGDIKNNILGSGSFLLRGLNKAGGEFTLTCIAHNLKKIYNYIKCDENDKELKNIKELAIKLV